MRFILTTSIEKLLLSFFADDGDNFSTKERADIATKLIHNERCVVGGDKPLWVSSNERRNVDGELLWVGSIGNYIETEKHDDHIGCLVYKFDLKRFLSSKIFREFYDARIKKLNREAEAIIDERDELKNNLKYLNYLSKNQ